MDVINHEVPCKFSTWRFLLDAWEVEIAKHTNHTDTQWANAVYCLWSFSLFSGFEEFSVSGRYFVEGLWVYVLLKLNKTKQKLN